MFFAAAECTVSYSTEPKSSIRAFAGWLKRVTSLINQTGHAAVMNFRSVRNSLATVAILFFATGCDNTEAVAQGSPQGRPPTEVGVVTLQPQSVDVTTELPGRTTAARLAEVRPQVNGIILKRLFTEGAEVKAGSSSTRSIRPLSGGTGYRKGGTGAGRGDRQFIADQGGALPRPCEVPRGQSAGLRRHRGNPAGERSRRRFGKGVIGPPRSTSTIQR